MPLIRFVFTLCAVLTLARVAYADDPATRAAKRHFDRGQKLFTLGKFDEALDEYQKAFDASPIPDFLYNIGQCYRNLGNYEQAIFSFKRYLQLDPEAENRDKVEIIIDELEDKLERQSAKDGHPPPPPPPKGRVDTDLQEVVVLGGRHRRRRGCGCRDLCRDATRRAAGYQPWKHRLHEVNG
jgi:tetratricopeptide (TPR) repeat protein